MDALLYVVGLIFTAGGASIVTTIFKGRAEARKVGAETRSIDAKTAGDVDSVAIQGAENAVLTLQAANSSLLQTITAQQIQIDRQAAMITTLDQQAVQLRAALQTAERAVAEARELQSGLEDQLVEYHRLKSQMKRGGER